jgi:CRISPR-associated endonuclease Csn1
MLYKTGSPHGNKIRHIRVWASISDPLKIKKQTNLSKAEHKQYYYAGNATNSFFAVYKGEDKNDFDFRNLFETAQLIGLVEIKKNEDLFEPKILIKKSKKEIELNLRYVLTTGTKVIFLQQGQNKEEIKSLPQFVLTKRLYVYTNFEKDGRLNFKYHLEARSKIEEDYTESELDFNKPKPTLRFSYSRYDFLVEGYDFAINMDGTISWKF